VQVKFNQYIKKVTAGHSRPVSKFIRDIIFGILKSGEVKLDAISGALNSRASIKKTSERLGRHLRKVGLDRSMNRRLPELNKRLLSGRTSYMILDLSDISKPQARKMEGLGLVRDGSASGDEPVLVNGYYLCNVIGRVSGEECIYPLYSELYSLDAESTSENSKILDAVRTVGVNIPKGIWVLDRGGDRQMLITPLLKQGRGFIIRQMGTRNLRYRDKDRPFTEVAGKVKLQYTCKSGSHTFQCGAIPVGYKGFDTRLWLVVSRYKKGGYFYFLCHLPDAFSPKTAVVTALEGYSMRWSIEEVHRHVKGDFNLEDVRLLTYQSLKNLMPLLWCAISFLYVKLNSITTEMIAKSKIKILVRDKLSELTGFIYYKTYKALKFILNNVSLRKCESFKGLFNEKYQLSLTL
jgi:hypothetical protein